MKILMVHNQYLIRGGEDESFDNESSLLESYGNTVFKYIQNNNNIDLTSKLKLGIRTIWSNQDYRNLRFEIKEKKPDIVHVQNFFPLISPAVYYAAKQEGVPVVQSLRNYRFKCLNGYLFRNRSICENCLHKSIPISGLVNKCYRDNSAASFAVASMLTIHRVMQTWNKMVDSYIALTEFAKQKFIEGGLPAEKITLKPNFVYDPGIGDGSDDFMLYVGRLSPEKGINTLLEAWKTLGKVIPLKIVGEGSLREKVEQMTNEFTGLEYLGRKPISEVYKLMGKSKALIFPSQWYEGLPRTIIESFATGTPVIASNLGSMSNLIEHQRTGLHFPPGSYQGLIEQVNWIIHNPHQWKHMRKQARLEFKSKYTAETNYQQLMQIYSQLSAKK